MEVIFYIMEEKELEFKVDTQEKNYRTIPNKQSI